MSRDRFQTYSGAFESSMMDELENPFKNFERLENGQESYNTSEGVQNESVPVQAQTNLFEGELSINKGSLNFSVPLEFEFSGRKYSISVLSNNSTQKGELHYIVNASDGSGFKIEFAAIPSAIKDISSPRSTNTKSGIIIHINSTNNLGQVESAKLIYSPNIENFEKTMSDLKRVLKNAEGTYIDKFLNAFHLFDSIGPVNPKSILTNPAILFGPTLRQLGLGSRLLSSNELGEEMESPGGENMGLLTLKCGPKLASCIIDAIKARKERNLLNVGKVLATCTGAVPDCIEFVKKLVSSEEKTSGVDCPPGQIEDKDPVTGKWYCRESLAGTKVVPRVCPPGQIWRKVTEKDKHGYTSWDCVPDDSTSSMSPSPTSIPPVIVTASLSKEFIRWVQTVLKVAAGASELEIDENIGPKTRAVIKDLQRRFDLRIDGLVNQQTTIALIQLGLNHIAKSKLDIDGKMGPQTREVIKAFQTTNGLISDGIVGSNTRRAMVKLLSPDIPSESTSVKGSGELYQESEDSGKWFPLQELP